MWDLQTLKRLNEEADRDFKRDLSAITVRLKKHLDRYVLAVQQHLAKKRTDGQLRS